MDTDRIQVVIARRLLNHHAKEGVFAVHAIDDERKTIMARYVFGVPIFMVLVLHRVGVVADQVGNPTSALDIADRLLVIGCGMIAREVLAIKEAMEQSLAPGSQTFEQDLFRLYRDGTITLDEALGNADSPTNLSWLINNSEITSPHGKDEKASETALEFSETNSSGTSFKEFTLSLNDADDDANHGQ